MPEARSFLARCVQVTIDRPLGSRHPRYGFFYPVNYGYLEGVPAPDGHFLDAYVLGVGEPLVSFTGICIAVIHRLNDVDDKLVVVPEELKLSDKEIRRLTRFQEKWFKSVVLRD